MQGSRAFHTLKPAYKVIVFRNVPIFTIGSPKQYISAEAEEVDRIDRQPALRCRVVNLQIELLPWFKLAHRKRNDSESSLTNGNMWINKSE